MTARLPQTWLWTDKPNLSFASAQQHDGLYCEIQSVANYWRCQILLDAADHKRWDCAVMAHANGRDEAIAKAEAMAVACGMALPREAA